ncbi:MAG TPA: TetR-like C-terminal domain-containing protein [Acidimicrobiia bacterium]|jgi:AcrR family transcriptional regulator|nr:TetR-like C-terminal domain-containing protein [Acidimicrobiia bacterium]
MPRAGLSADAVVAVAAALLDADPATELTLSRVAVELGVKTPSLYNHVAGLGDLRRRVAMAGIVELGDALRTAVMGRSGPDAVRALAAAYRAYAVAHPGIYPLTQEARPGDPEYAALGLRTIEPAAAALRSCDVAEDELIHRIRAVRSALHGFVLLETRHGFGIPVDIDASFETLIEILVTSCRTPA